MNEHGLGRELEALRRRIGPVLCSSPAPCMRGASTELILRGDGTQGRIGQAPPPLCPSCPERESRRPRVRHIEVVRDLRNRHGGEVATSGARVAAAGHDAGPEGHGSPEPSNAPTAPDDGLVLPAAWGPSHPERLIAEGREPELPRRSFAGHEGTIRIDPRDFGL